MFWVSADLSDPPMMILSVWNNFPSARNIRSRRQVTELILMNLKNANEFSFSKKEIFFSSPAAN